MRNKQPCFCTCCRQAQFERDEKAFSIQRSEVITDADRIAAAVTVLKSIEFLSKEFADAEARNPDSCIVVKTDLLNRAGNGMLKALAILEGRDQVNV